MSRIAWLPLWSAIASCTLMAPTDDELSGAHGQPDAAVGCALGKVRCGDACVSPLDPAFGCGTCVPCKLPHAKALCAAGGCAIAACEPGFLECDGQSANGCEACGRCGARCDGATPTCSQGVCVPKCNAIELVTTTARLEAPSAGWSVGTADFTLELWLELHQKFGAAPDGRIISLPGLLGVVLASRNRVPNIELGISPAGNGVGIPLPIEGGWHHVAFVRRSGGARLEAWLDGALVKGVDTTEPFALETDASVVIGADGPTGAAPVRLGPIRFSRIARYAGSFTPSTWWNVDAHTVSQWLTRQAFDGLGLVDEAGGDSYAATKGHVESWVQTSPCP